MTYTINVELLPLLKDKLKKFESKFNKYGNGSITCAVGGTRTVKTKKGKELVVDVDIEASYKINGYDFIGTLDYNPDVKENIIKLADHDVVVPTEYRNRVWCDHCKTNHNRLHTVLLKNHETNEFIQVGKSCVKDFLGCDLGNYASYLSIFDDIDDYIENSTHDRSFRGKVVWDFDEIVGQTLESVNHYGYISKQQSYDYGNDSTSSRVWLAMNQITNFDGDIIYEEYEITDDDKSKVAEIKEFLNNFDDTNNEYVHNLKNFSKMPYIEGENFGLVVSVVGWYLREINKANRIEKAKKESKSEYIGNVGDKVTFTATPNCVYSYDTEFGMCYIYKFLVGENEVVWKTSKCLGDVEITLKGTIKSTNTYNGVKQTEVTRCRVA